MSHEKLLKEYNQWRRGDDGYEMPDPTAIGIAIDSVLAQLAALKKENESLKARVAILMEAATKVRYIDGLGASRISPADCRDGISYVAVADTIYWPLSAEEAQLLRSSECGRGDFTGPAHRPIAAALAEALEEGLQAEGENLRQAFAKLREVNDEK